MFEAEITWVGPMIKSRKNGFYRTVVLKTFGAERNKGKVFLNPDHRNYAQWEPLLEEGTIVRNLLWKRREDGTIDGDSPVEAV